MTAGKWSKITLGELCDRDEAEIQTGPFGSQLHSSDYVTSGIPVIPTEAIGRREIRNVWLPQVSPGYCAAASTPSARYERHIVRSARDSGDGIFRDRA
jgi:hypothetical protein